MLTCYIIRGTQRQFLENICAEDDLRSRMICGSPFVPRRGWPFNKGSTVLTVNTAFAFL